MSAKDTEEILSELAHLHIDDSRVNKMHRRRSIRIQAQIERRRTLDLNFSYDLFNNNLTTEITPIKTRTKTKSKNEFELEYENVHYKEAIKHFQYIRDNQYVSRQKKSNDSDDGCNSCGCRRNANQITNGIKGCGRDCLNQIMNIECGRGCLLGNFCENQRFQNYENARCTIFITEKKGYGLFASTSISIHSFIMEFVGEVVSMSEFKKRSREYAKQKVRHHYVMASAGSKLIDATRKGNLTRFVNHSCNSNAETQKWTVNGQCRIGIFSKRDIKQFEEITIDYQFERFGCVFL